MGPQPGGLMANLYVRRLDTQEIVSTIALRRTDSRYVEKVMAGMLINMDTDTYFIDDSECE